MSAERQLSRHDVAQGGATPNGMPKTTGTVLRLFDADLSSRYKLVMRLDARLNLERVLVAAKACFAEHGAEVTMDEVASRAGVGTGTLYRRFPSRAALVEALYDDAVEQVAAEAATLATHADAWEALVRWCGAYVDLLATKRTLLAESAPLLERRPELIEAQRRRARATFADFLERAQASGTARAGVDAADVVALLNATMTAGRPNAAMLDIVLAGIRADRS